MISVIVPAFNEQQGIVNVIKRIRKILPKAEIIVVDDGSTDNTYKLAKGMRVKVLKHKKNLGKAAALKTGYRNASFDVIVNIDADCSYPPEEIPKLMKKLNSGCDMVVGSRFWNRNPKGFAWYRKLANIIGAKITSLIVGRKVTDVTSGMRAFKRDIAKLNVNAEGLDYEAELTAKAIKLGFRYCEVPINFEGRLGQSKLKFFRDCFKFFIAVLRGRFY